MERQGNAVRTVVTGFFIAALAGFGSAISPVTAISETIVIADSIEEALAEAYSGVASDQVPTGILLERGAIYGDALVLRSDGGTAAGRLSRTRFETAYADLRRGAFSASLPSVEALDATARTWRESSQATPIGLAVIKYDTLVNTPEPEHDGRRFIFPRGRLGETRTFVGTVAFVDKVYHWAPTFVVPADLLMLNGVAAGSVSGLSVQIGTAPAQAVQLGVAFQPQWLPAGPGPLPYSVTFSVDGEVFTTGGTIGYVGPDGGPNAPPHGPPSDPSGPRNNPALPSTFGTWHTHGVYGNEFIKYWDLDDPVTGGDFDAPWDEFFQTSDAGQLNIRIIPADESAVTNAGDGTFIFELLNPVVIVDGFDVLNVRTQNDILNDFGSTIKKLLDLGFDIISVDYQNGRDWIERNGRAFRTLMTDNIVDLVDSKVLEKQGVAVVAGSMGTQVSRWGLVEAEENGEDHHTRLFVNIDGPFFGATIPIGFQAAAVDLAFQAPAAAAFRGSLESPAASQMLMRTFPRGAGILSNGWYAPRTEFLDYYGAVLGTLPQESRNVTGASGSGNGTLQTDLGADARLLRAEGSTGGFFGGGKFHVDVRGDGAGARVYESEIKKSVFGLTIYKKKVAWDLDDGLGLDVLPGGYRLTTHDFIQGVGPTIEVEGTEIDVHYLYDIDRHSFVPTTSAIGTEVWDDQVSQKCNTQHASPAPALESMVLSEVTAFKDGVTPPPATQFAAACNVPEPVENCSPGVIWYADPEDPVYVQPTFDGANCRVIAQPAGLDAGIAGNNYVVAPDTATCFDGSAPQGFGCPYTTITGDVLSASIPEPGVLVLEVFDDGGGGGGPSSCPNNTTFVSMNETDDGIDIVVCDIQTPPGVPVSQLYLQQLTVMAPADVSCSIGVAQPIGGEIHCYLGSPPVGTSAFTYAGSFYYNGWD